MALYVRRPLLLGYSSVMHPNDVNRKSLIMTEIWRIKIEKQEKDQGILSVCLIRFSGDDFCIVCDRYPVCDEFVLFAF
jgi:hypothetical protein